MFGRYWNYSLSDLSRKAGADWTASVPLARGRE
jgi:hypothetical protein